MQSDPEKQEIQNIVDLKKNQPVMPRLLYILVLPLVQIISCHNNDSSILTDTQFSQIQDSVRQMAAQIAADVSRDGPIAWLRHFADTTGFFMAAEGQLMFPNYDSASEFVQTRLTKMISKIQLSWSDIRIDPLTAGLAVMGASYKEVITDSAGRVMPGSGYFTAVAQKTSHGWKLRNAHWSNLATVRSL